MPCPSSKKKGRRETTSSNFSGVSVSIKCTKIRLRPNYPWFRLSPYGGNTITIGTTPISGGADTQVLFNDGGFLGSDAGLTYNKTTDIATLVGGLNITALTTGSVLFVGAGGAISQDNAGLFYDDTLNSLGIGDATPDAFLSITATRTATTGVTAKAINIGGTLTANGVQATGVDFGFTIVADTDLGHIMMTTNCTFDPQVAMTANIVGLNNGVTVGGSSANNITALNLNVGTAIKGGTYTGTITTVTNYVVSTPSGFSAGQITNFRGMSINAITNGDSITTGTITNDGIRMAATSAGNNTGGTINNYGLHVLAFTAAAASGGTVNNRANFITVPSGSGAGTTNNRGIYLTGNGGSGGAGTTNNFAFYSDSTANSVMNGNLKIGNVTAATALLHLAAGTATASTAPLKFTSGTLLTTAEAGVMEFLTDTFYLTITTAAQRQRIVTDVKRITSVASSATPTPNIDTTDVYIITALAAAAAFGAPTGTATQGKLLMIRIKDNGTARALTYNAIYRAGTTVALPTTTTISKTLYLGFIYNSTDTKWDLLSYSDGYT